MLVNEPVLSEAEQPVLMLTWSQGGVKGVGRQICTSIALLAEAEGFLDSSEKPVTGAYNRLAEDIKEENFLWAGEELAMSCKRNAGTLGHEHSLHVLRDEYDKAVIEAVFPYFDQAIYDAAMQFTEHFYTACKQFVKGVIFVMGSSRLGMTGVFSGANIQQM